MDNTRIAESLWREHGAVDVRYGTIHAGNNVGDVFFSVDFPDWEIYGKAQAAMADNVEYKALNSKIREEGSYVSSRTLTVGFT